MRPHIPAAAAVLLLTAACSTSSTTAGHTPSATPSAASPSSSAVQAPRLQVAIPAAKLPYKPAAGAPALGDVRVIATPTDPCVIPADNSGDEAQLLDAKLDVNVLVVTFEFTNPCTTPLAYRFTVTQAIGGPHGPSGGPSDQVESPAIQPGRSVSFAVNVDPAPSLTDAQLQRLWVGVTHIAKQPAL